MSPSDEKTNCRNHVANQLIDPTINPWLRSQVQARENTVRVDLNALLKHNQGWEHWLEPDGVHFDGWVNGIRGHMWIARTGS